MKESEASSQSRKFTIPKIKTHFSKIFFFHFGTAIAKMFNTMVYTFEKFLKTLSLFFQHECLEKKRFTKTG